MVGGVFPRVSSISKIRINPGSVGISTGFELRILLRAHNEICLLWSPKAAKAKQGRDTGDPYTLGGQSPMPGL